MCERGELRILQVWWISTSQVGSKDELEIEKTNEELRRERILIVNSVK